MNKNIQQFSVDSPDPVVLPDDVSLTNIAQRIPPNRNSVAHTNTSRNNISTQKTATQNTNNVKSNCNCGIYTGYRYEFSIVYKKTEQSKNPNTNQIRRDWLYMQLVGNINSTNIKSDRFLIYLK